MKNYISFGLNISIGFLIALIAFWIILTIVYYKKIGNSVSKRFKYFITGFRIFIFTALLICVWQPRMTSVLEEKIKNTYLVIAIDNSKSMTIPDGINGKTRIDSTKEIISENSDFTKNITTRISPDHIRYYSFGDKCKKLTKEKDKNIEATEGKTNIKTCVEKISRDLSGLPVSGVVLFSDGNDNCDSDVYALGSSLKNKSIPVFAVGTGGSPAFKDAGIVSFVGPEDVWEKNIFVIKALIKYSGSPVKNVPVIFKEGDNVLETKYVSFDRNKTVAALSFNVNPIGTGLKSYNIDIPAIKGEVFTENNKDVWNVYVKKTPDTKILFLCHTLGYDYMFLRSLKEKLNFQFAAAIKTSPQTYIRQIIEGMDNLENGFPETKEDLFKYNIILLYNVNFGNFSKEQLTWINEFVKVKGGGLCVFGENTGYLAKDFALKDILPVEVDAEAPKAGAYKFKVTDEGNAHEILSSADPRTFKDLAKNESISFESYTNIKNVKAGAVVLADILDTEKKREVPFLVAQQSGFGRVFYIGTGGLWKWKMLINHESNVYESFWKQTILWLTVQTLHEGGISIKFDKSSHFLGDTSNIDIECFDENNNVIKDANLKGKSEKSGGPAGQIQIINQSNGKYLGKFELKTAGLHKITVEGSAGGKPLRAASALIYVKNNDLEFKETTINEPLLKKLAGFSNGEYFKLEELDKLYGKMDESVEARVNKTINRDLWDNPLLILLLLGLLSAEWVLRKRKGLF